MIDELFNYFKGYLLLELSGIYKERFINLCKNKEIQKTTHIYTLFVIFYKLSYDDFNGYKKEEYLERLKILYR